VVQVLLGAGIPCFATQVEIPERDPGDEEIKHRIYFRKHLFGSLNDYLLKEALSQRR
jgi:hypothetical protein